MPSLVDLASGLRAKNAGPFWVTIDIFFTSKEAYQRAVSGLRTADVAAALQQDISVLKRFDLEQIHVIKFSFPRPVVQGHRRDRDMHGAQFAWLLNDIAVSA